MLLSRPIRFQESSNSEREHKRSDENVANVVLPKIEAMSWSSRGLLDGCDRHVDLECIGNRRTSRAAD